MMNAHAGIIRQSSAEPEQPPGVQSDGVSKERTGPQGEAASGGTHS